MLKIDAVDVQLFLIVLFYIICCPYTKVEESFNMQAVFDIMNFGINLSSYDHLQFPGVVPRTFLGSMVVSVLCVPLKILIRFFSLPELYQQIACRSVVGFLSWISFVHFRNGVEEKFGTRASQLTGVLTAFQFHICFYMSRSLPNVFALMLSLNAFAFWLKVRTLLIPW
jgi:alpha-1,6-mannosyltransferase